MDKNLKKKVDFAISLIKNASKIARENGCPELEVAYSGGKDSDVILELTKMAEVPYRAIYKNTTIDPAGTIKHAKDAGAEILRPKYTFFELIQRMGFPNMFKRFCCGYLKEYKVLDYAIVGIRRSESRKRKDRYQEPEQCRVYSKTKKVRQYFPILNWDDSDVDAFIKERNIKCAPVYYDEHGEFHVDRRLGCVGCPMLDKKRIQQFKEHPNMVKAYIRAASKYMDNHPKQKEKYGNVYAWFVRDVFYWRKKQEEWNEINSNGTDWKSWLEDYFNIKFK